MDTYINLNNEIEVFIPVKKCFIYIETKDLFDNIAYEEIFLFIGDGRTFDDIKDITTYKTNQVENILKDFQDWKFIEESDFADNKRLNLTEEGKKLYRIIKEKHIFNDRNIEVYINCFSGNLEIKDKECKDSIVNNSFILKNKIDLSLFNNLNQGYSKEIYENFYKSSSITDDDMSHINIRIDIKDKKNYYISKKITFFPNFIKSNPILSLNDNNSNTSNKTPNKLYGFNVGSKIIQFKLIYKDNSLSKYIDIFSSLQRVNETNPSLISSAGLKILEDFDTELKINNSLSENDFFLDTITGNIYKSLKINDNKGKTDISLKKDFNLKNIDNSLLNKLFDSIPYDEISSDFRLEYKFLKEISVINHINFDFLE